MRMRRPCLCINYYTDHNNRLDDYNFACHVDATLTRASSHSDVHLALMPLLLTAQDLAGEVRLGVDVVGQELRRLLHDSTCRDWSRAQRTTYMTLIRRRKAPS